jgi:hypothetical protein
MRFFVLIKPEVGSSEDRHGGTDIIQADGTQTGDFPKCPTCGAPLGMREWLPPYRVDLETWGDEFGDVSAVSDVLVISERFLRIFREHGFHGLSDFKAVEVIHVRHHRRKPKAQPPRYFRASIHRSATTVDQVSSGYVWDDQSKVCPVCLRGGTLKRFVKVVIDGRTWDGDDIFWPRSGGQLLVTERLKAVCEEHEIRGAVFCQAETYGYDYYPWERDDWDIRLFDETLAILRSRNTTGQFEPFLQAMNALRKQVATGPKFDWMENLRRRFGEGVNDVADAASKAYRNLIRSP